MLIVRRRLTYFASGRRVAVYVDGTLVARLRIGSTVSLQVSPGRHSVYLRMDWIKSSPIAVRTARDHDTRIVIAVVGVLFAALRRRLFRTKLSRWRIVVDPPGDQTNRRS